MAKTSNTKPQVKKSKAKELKPDTSDLNTYLIDIQNPKSVYNLYTSEFSGLDPSKLKYYLESARKGLNFWKSLLFEEIRRRDLRIGGVCQTRKLGVAKEKWRIKFAEDSQLTEQMQNELKYFVKTNFESINFVQFICDIVEAQIQGVSTFELIYDLRDNKICIGEICYVPNHLLLFDDLTNQYNYLDPAKADAMALRMKGWQTAEDRIDTTELQLQEINPLKILEAESLDGNAQNGFQNGCIDSLIWAYLFKNYGIKDWSIYVERFASPGVVGKYPPLMNKTDKAKLFEAVRNWGNLFKATIPKECEIELITDTAKASTQSLFERYIDYWDKNIGIRVLGQSLTTDIGNVGSKAAAQTHDEVREDLKIADMILITTVVNKLIRRLIDFNYPSMKEYPMFEFEEAEDIDRKLKRSEILTNIKTAGYTVKKESIEQEFGYELEEYDENQPDNTPEGVQTYIKNFIQEYYNGLQR